MMENRLLDNLHSIRGRIEASAVKSGRSADAVTLIAVTKYVNFQTTMLLAEAGEVDFGESRPQVLWEKAEGLEADAIRWHMIGHLQRNKVDRTLPLCSLIHSVDSRRLLRSIDSAAGKLERQCECLLEVNISGESAKHGFQSDELESVLNDTAELKNVRVRGLMGMASLTGDLKTNQKEFGQLRELRDRLLGLQSENIDLSELSMGMSSDFEQAIEEGATLVRIGSVLFDGVND